MFHTHIRTDPGVILDARASWTVGSDVQLSHRKWETMMPILTSSVGVTQFDRSLWQTVNFSGGSEGKASACDVGDPGSVPGWGRSPGEGNGHPLRCSCLENPLDKGAWWTAIHGVTKSQTWLERWTLSLSLSHPLSVKSDSDFCPSVTRLFHLA